MYRQSNEIEEVGIVNLNGVNIENNPEMEALLGVSSLLFSLIHTNSHKNLTETFHIHPLYILEFLRFGRTQSEGIHIMDI